MHFTFADGMTNIAITGPLIRIDYGVATPVQTTEGKQELRMTQTQHMVMPMEGVVRAFTFKSRSSRS